MIGRCPRAVVQGAHLFQEVVEGIAQQLIEVADHAQEAARRHCSNRENSICQRLGALGRRRCLSSWG